MGVGRALIALEVGVPLRQFRDAGFVLNEEAVGLFAHDATILPGAAGAGRPETDSSAIRRRAGERQSGSMLRIRKEVP